MRLFAVDPGLREAGVALFVDDELDSARLITHYNGDGPSQWIGMGNAIADGLRELGGGRLWPNDELIIEYMQTRRGRRDAHDALIQLSLVSGVVYALGPRPAWHAPPRLWTGRRPKSKNHKRIRRRLSNDETERLDEALAGCPPSNHKELLDAVGIGLWHLKRL